MSRLPYSSSTSSSLSYRYPHTTTSTTSSTATSPILRSARLSPSTSSPSPPRLSSSTSSSSSSARTSLSPSTTTSSLLRKPSSPLLSSSSSQNSITNTSPSSSSLSSSSRISSYDRYEREYGSGLGTSRYGNSSGARSSSASSLPTTSSSSSSSSLFMNNHGRDRDRDRYERRSPSILSHSQQHGDAGMMFGSSGMYSSSSSSGTSGGRSRSNDISRSSTGSNSSTIGTNSGASTSVGGSRYEDLIGNYSCPICSQSFLTQDRLADHLYVNSTCGATLDRITSGTDDSNGGGQPLDHKKKNDNVSTLSLLNHRNMERRDVIDEEDRSQLVFKKDKRSDLYLDEHEGEKDKLRNSHDDDRTNNNGNGRRSEKLDEEDGIEVLALDRQEVFSLGNNSSSKRSTSSTSPKEETTLRQGREQEYRQAANREITSSSNPSVVSSEKQSLYPSSSNTSKTFCDREPTSHWRYGKTVDSKILIDNMMIVASIKDQFSFGGNDACTTISIEAAIQFLFDEVKLSDMAVNSVIIDRIVQVGCMQDAQVGRQAFSEVYQRNDRFRKQLKVLNSHTQMLGEDTLLAMLQDMMSASKKNNGAGICVVVTKQPETIVLYYSGRANVAETNQRPFFVAFDSHPKTTDRMAHGSHLIYFLPDDNGSFVNILLYLGEWMFPREDYSNSAYNQLFNSFTYTLVCAQSDTGFIPFEVETPRASSASNSQPRQLSPSAQVISAWNIDSEQQQPRQSPSTIATPTEEHRVELDVEERRRTEDDQGPIQRSSPSQKSSSSSQSPRHSPTSRHGGASPDREPVDTSPKHIEQNEELDQRLRVLTEELNKMRQLNGRLIRQNEEKDQRIGQLEEENETVRKELQSYKEHVVNCLSTQLDQFDTLKRSMNQFNISLLEKLIDDAQQ